MRLDTRYALKVLRCTYIYLYGDRDHDDGGGIAQTIDDDEYELNEDVQCTTLNDNMDGPRRRAFDNLD